MTRRSTTGNSRNGSGPSRIDGALVVGGGYAGLHAAAALQQSGAPVTVLDSRPHHSFVTRLASVAGGTAPLGDAFATFDELGYRALSGHVDMIDDREVILADGTRLQAEVMVVTAGAVPTLPDLPGIERTMPLRTAVDAARLRVEVDRSHSVVIVGAGATGIQLAGAISAAHPEVRVHVVDRDERVLASLGRPLGDHAEQLLAGRGVGFELGHEIDRVTDTGVQLDSGRTIDGLVVWAGGFEGRADSFGALPVDNGRLVIDENLRVDGLAHTFAAGDMAAHHDDAGEPFAMSAQIAVQAGRQAGENAARLLADEPLHRARLNHRGWVLDLGGNRGVAEIGPITLAAPVVDLLPPLLHLAIDLKTLWGIGGAEAIRRFRPGAHAADPEALTESQQLSSDPEAASASG